MDITKITKIANENIKYEKGLFGQIHVKNEIAPLKIKINDLLTISTNNKDVEVIDLKDCDCVDVWGYDNKEATHIAEIKRDEINKIEIF